MKGGVVFCQK